MPINRILIREHALCESLTDDDDGIFTFILDVEVVEIATAEDGNPERGKESGRNDTPLRTRILFAIGMNMTVGGECKAHAGDCIAAGEHKAQNGRFDARERIPAPKGYHV